MFKDLEVRVPSDRNTGRVLRIAKFLAICLITLVLMGGAGFYYAWKWHNGPALANRLAKSYNSQRRGRLTIGSVRWTPRAALDILRGRDSTVTVRNLTFYDSKGRRVAHFPKIVTEAKLWPLIMKGSFKVTRAEADEAQLRIDYYARPEGPDRATGDTHEVGLFGAFEHVDPFHEREKVPSVYNFERIRVKRLALSFYHRRFQVHFRQSTLTGNLFVTASTPTTPLKIRFSVKPHGGQGELHVAGRRLPLTDIEAPYVRTDPKRPHDLELALGGRVDGATFRLKSRMERLILADNSTLSVNAHFTHFAALLAKITGLDIRGVNETLTLQAQGPLHQTTTDAQLSGLTATVGAGRQRVRVKDIVAKLQLSGEQLTVKSLSGRTLDGTVSAAGTVQLRGRRFAAKVKLSDLKLSPLLASKTHKRLLGGKLQGQLALRGTLSPWAVDLDSLDMRLDRTCRTGLLPRRLRLRGRGRYSQDALHMSRLLLTGYGLRLTARGDVGLTSRKLKLAVTMELGRLRSLLRSAGLSGLAHSGSLHGQLRGTFDNPRLYGSITLRQAGYNKLRSPQVSSRISFAGGTVSFDKLRGGLGGGLLTGSGHVQLFRRGQWKLRAHPSFKTRLTVTNASLRQLMPKRSIAGRVTAQITFRGRPRRYTGEGLIKLKNGLFAGQRIHSGVARVRLKDNRLELQKLQMSWAGGNLDAKGRVQLNNGDLSLAGKVTNLPLAALSDNPAFRRMVSGVLSGNFAISGQKARPVILAVLQLARVRVRGILMGGGKVRLSSGPDATTNIRGDLFRRFQLSGRMTLGSDPGVRITVRFDKLPIHELVPELTRLPAKVTATASGRIELDFSLAHGLRRVAATLSKLNLQIAQIDHLPGETPQRVTMTNEGNVVLLFDGKRLRVKHLKLRGSAGRLAAKGWLSPAAAALAVDGHLELGDLSFLLKRWVDEVKGRAYVKATVRGSLAKPRLEGDLILAGVRILLPDRIVPLRIATARLRVTNHLLEVKQARVAVYTDEFSITGRVKIKEFVPQRLNLRLRGKLSAQILRLALPRTFSQVTGRALALLHLTGTPESPSVAGWIKLEPIGFTLRGTSREFGIKSGLITIVNKRIRIKEVRGTVDGGTFVADGRIKLKSKWPYDMSISLRGQSIPVKKSRSYELELNTNLRLRVVDGKASISGLVDVADGRFTETFDVVSRAFLKRRVFEQRAPFWESNKLFRDAKLNITVSSHGPLLIKNNLADIRLEGNINLRGTPLKPKFGGQIRAESGTFRIPFLRGQFSVRSGDLDFDHPFGFGETYVKIVGETTYTDTSDTEHTITVSLEGPVSRIGIKLSSSTGLNQSQVLMLLASGRTMDQLRKQARRGDTGPGSTARSANPLDAYDSSLKQVTGDFLSQLVARPLQAWTRLDLVRLEMGTESFQLRVNKQFGRNIRLAGEAEFGLMGRQRQEGRVEVRVLDQLSVNAKARRLIPGEDTFTEQDRYQGRFELRFRVRLRTSLRRSLGF
jgi:autotransporter translocation and assembly factor TamB